MASPHPSKSTPRKATSQKSPRNSLSVPTSTALIVLLAARTVAALSVPISDCDEVFNYWDPMHLLTHGKALQTWEYHPRFALRSWAYVALHSIVPFFTLIFTSSSVFAFYALRVTLAALCACVEHHLYSTLATHPGYSATSIPKYYLLFSVFSTGLFISSPAFLPSSFAMMTTTMAVSCALRISHNRRRIYATLVFMAIGTVWGWPFVGVLVLPYALHELATASSGFVLRKRLQFAFEAIGLVVLFVVVCTCLAKSPWVASFGFTA